MSAQAAFYYNIKFIKSELPNTVKLEFFEQLLPPIPRYMFRYCERKKKEIESLLFCLI